MDDQIPDAKWRIEWLESQDHLEVEAWLIGDVKGFKLGSINTFMAEQNPEIKQAFMQLMKQVAIASRHAGLGANNGTPAA